MATTRQKQTPCTNTTKGIDDAANENEGSDDNDDEETCGDDNSNLNSNNTTKTKRKQCTLNVTFNLFIIN